MRGTYSSLLPIDANGLRDRVIFGFFDVHDCFAAKSLCEKVLDSMTAFPFEPGEVNFDIGIRRINRQRYNFSQVTPSLSLPRVVIFSLLSLTKRYTPHIL